LKKIYPQIHYFKTSVFIKNREIPKVNVSRTLEIKDNEKYHLVNKDFTKKIPKNYFAKNDFLPTKYRYIVFVSATIKGDDKYNGVFTIDSDEQMNLSEVADYINEHSGESEIEVQKIKLLRCYTSE